VLRGNIEECRQSGSTLRNTMLVGVAMTDRRLTRVCSGPRPRVVRMSRIEGKRRETSAAAEPPTRYTDS
jgi:hypothetical protein